MEQLHRRIQEELKRLKLNECSEVALQRTCDTFKAQEEAIEQAAYAKLAQRCQNWMVPLEKSITVN